MSRKVYIEADVIVNVPVKVRIHRVVHADEDANIEKAVRDSLKGKTHGKADVYDDAGEQSEIIEINGTEPPADDYEEPSDHLPYAVDELIEANKGRLVEGSFKVIDSK